MTTFPWHVDAKKIIDLSGNGGQTFADFLSALLRAQGAASGVRIDAIRTTTRVNVADGGVDAAVDKPLYGPLALNTPTCWQFKATEYSSSGKKGLAKEVEKGEVKRLIQAGYTYCYCICDDAPPRWLAATEKELFEIVRELNPDAPPPRILTAGPIADWANRFPSIVLQFFEKGLGTSLGYNRWLKKEQAQLATFVDVTSRADFAKELREFVAATQRSVSVLSLRGPAGVGLSRFVAETLADVAHLVVYVPGPAEAVRVATSLLNQPNATAILVIDRCSGQVRNEIEGLLRAEAGRLKAVVVLDPTDDSADVSIDLKKLEQADIQRIIEANFEGIPSTHRRAFVDLADGVLKIAAQLASAYVVKPFHSLEAVSKWAHDELASLVRDENDRQVLRALSLFPRVGYSGDVSSEFDAVCAIFELNRTDAFERCKRLAERPGIVCTGPRYLTVQPPLFVRRLFEEAWNRAVERDVDAFIGKLSPKLRALFLDRAGECASATVRARLATWATPWIRKLAAADLTSTPTLEELVRLVHIAPERFGPRLADLVEAATKEPALVGGEQGLYWNRRTQVIFALRDLLERSDTYEHAERALFHLAQTEKSPARAVTQPASATQTWAASFRVFLSGTTVPIAQRLSILESRLTKNGDAAVPLVIVALDLALNNHASKSEGRSVAFGALRPCDWQPETCGELWANLDRAIALLGPCFAKEPHRTQAFRVLKYRGRGLLRSGRLSAMKAVVGGLELSDAERVVLMGIADDYLRCDTKSETDAGERVPTDYVNQVAAWRASLSRADLRSRVLEAISYGASRARQAIGEDSISGLSELGVELFHEKDCFRQLLPSLVEDGHHGSALMEIGKTLGRADSEAALLAAIFKTAELATNPLVLRGYLIGLSELGPIHDAAIERGLESLEAACPKMAIDLSTWTPRIGAPAERAIRLIREGRLAPEEILTVPIPDNLLSDAMDAALETSDRSLEDAAALAIEIVVEWDRDKPLPTDDGTISLIWRALETAIRGQKTQADTWENVLRRLSETDFSRAINVACRAATDGEHTIADAAICELSVYIAKDPRRVLAELESHLLNVHSSSRTSVLLNSFPVECVTEWIEANGIDAARVAARVLRWPSLDADGNPVVPPLTEFVLENFETDEEVFWNFCRGGSSKAYSGDIAARYEEEAVLAARFHTHRLRRVREWAAVEEDSKRKSAESLREIDEECFGG